MNQQFATYNNREDALLTAREVAAILNISVSLAYRLTKDGSIPTVRFNRTVRVWRKDLDGFIQQSRSGAIQERLGTSF